MACPAATVYRNYFASAETTTPDGHGVGQRGRNQLNLLQDVEELLDNASEEYWRVQNGYCLPANSDSLMRLRERMRGTAMDAKVYKALVRVQ